MFDHKSLLSVMYELQFCYTKAHGGGSFVHYIFISYLRTACVNFYGINLYFCENSTSRMSAIVISKGTELLRIPQEKLVYISSEGNYSNVVTLDNRRRLVSFQLGQLEDLIGNQLGDEGSCFLRLGRGLIINTEYIYVIDIAKQQLILSDCATCYHELSASREVLIKLKAYIESLRNYEDGQK